MNSILESGHGWPKVNVCKGRGVSTNFTGWPEFWTGQG